MKQDTKKPVILMLEHDDDDRYMTQSILDEHHSDVVIDYVNNSDEFFTYLSNSTAQKAPSLILLNQHSVPSNAVEVLKSLKSAPHYAHIPVVVLSGSRNAEMIRECYKAGASSFVQKPDNNDEATDKISTFIHYWFKTVVLE